MKYYSYVEPDPNEDWTAIKTILSEQEILSQYWDYWTGQMKEAGKVDLINQQNCIDDFCTVHWAVQEPVYRFSDVVYQGAFVPHYDKYKGHTFVVDHFHEEDPTGKLVMLACLDDYSVKVDGYVDVSVLEIVNA